MRYFDARVIENRSLGGGISFFASGAANPSQEVGPASL